MHGGGEVAANFRRLYNYLYQRLHDANRAKKKEPIDETLKHLRVLRDSWSEMLQKGGEARYLEEVQAQQSAAAA
jgi:flagellin-specific chaperone FliS